MTYPKAFNDARNAYSFGPALVEDADPNDETIVAAAHLLQVGDIVRPLWSGDVFREVTRTDSFTDEAATLVTYVTLKNDTEATRRCAVWEKAV